MQKLFISEDAKVLEALEQLEKSSKKILFVQKEGELLATITDGDIRRWIIKHGSLDAPVKELSNYSPKYLYEGQKSRAEELMKQYEVDAIPILDEKKKIINIVFRDDSGLQYAEFEEKIPVVIMAGGLGTRLLPYTSILPKPLIPIGEFSITERIIQQFQQFGCNEFYMILNYKKNMVKAYFDDLEKDYEIRFVAEEKPLGTGGGLSLLKGKIGSTFILTNCDILIDDDLSIAYRQHKQSGNYVTMICSVRHYEIPYGIVHLEENGQYQSIQEKPRMSFLTNTGCYIVESAVLDILQYNERADFTDIIEKCRHAGYKVGIFPVSESAWKDMGQISGLEQMRKQFI